MKHLFSVFGVIGACLLSNTASAAVMGSVGGGNSGANTGRGVVVQSTTATGNLRGNAGAANAYKNNQRNTYFMVTQPDVDTACRQKIYACLSEYCGDVSIVPGQRESRCQYATESELYNYALLCLQKDTEVLLPQYGVNTANVAGGMNTAARLCPSYVQQELMSYMSMSNMANQLAKSHSDLCLQRRQELEAAMACHSVALAYGNETASKLTTQLNDFCGPGVPGGSAEMVTRFSNAGNVGADVWGWAEKIVSLEMNKKSADWQNDVNAILASYTNRMNLACGDNMQINTVSYNNASSQPNTLQTVAAMAIGSAFPSTNTNQQNPYANQSIWMELTSMSEIYKADDAFAVISAALGNPSTTQNAFLTTAQMDNMQQAYIRGTKVFILRDSARCYIVPVRELTDGEQSAVAQSFATCISK